MLRLVSNGVDLEVGSDISIRMQIISPLFQLNQIEVSKSFPFTLPCSKVNDPILKYHNRIRPPLRNINEYTNELPLDIYWGKYCLYSGTLYVNKCVNRKYTVNFVETPILDLTSDLIDNTTVYFDYNHFDDLDAMLDKFEEIAKATDLDDYAIPYYVFPVYNVGDTVNPWQNKWLYTSQEFAGRGVGEPTQYVVYFRLWRILMDIFYCSSIKVKDNFFSKYVIWKRACLFNTYEIDVSSTPYNIGVDNHLPQMKLVDFLLHLQNYLNIRFCFSNRFKKVEIVQIQDVLMSSGIIDWSENAESYFEKIIDPEYNGYSLTQNPDELDAFFAASGMDSSWVYNSLSTKNLIIDTDFSYVVDWNQDFNPGGTTLLGLVPTCEQVKADWASIKPRIIFYYGMGAMSGGYLYPKGTNYYNNELYAFIHDPTLPDDSIYTLYHEKYFDWLINIKQEYVFRKKLTVEDLLNFDFTKKRRIKNLNVLVDKIDVTLKKDTISTATISCFTV